MAKHIVNAMRPYFDKHPIYLEPFVGGGGMLKALPDHVVKIFSDIHPDVVAMWSALSAGWRPPEYVSEDEYMLYRRNPQLLDHNPPLRAFIAFGCSFGGKEWAGYARGYKPNDEVREHSGESYRSVISSINHVRNSFFFHCDYRYWSDIENALIYCDPPYANTTKYQVGGFDRDAFWNQVREWSDNGNTVFVSEFSAPDWADCVWQKDRHVTVNINAYHKKVDKLFLVTNQSVVGQKALL